MAKTSAPTPPMSTASESLLPQTQLRDYDNSWYQPGGLLKRITWLIVGRIVINTHFPWPIRIKIFILRLFGATVGERVMIKPKVAIKYPWFLTVENDVWIGEQVWIDNLTQVIIKSNACLSQGAMLLTGNHDFTSPTFDLITKPIEIQQGVWIGAKSVVCPGVTCHSHAVLAVQSVATRSLEAYSVYQGNPAVLVRRRIVKK